MVAKLTLRTHARDEVHDLTAELREVVAASGIRQGLCLVYCPHTTAAVVVNEGYDPAVTRDVTDVLNRLIPWQASYRHAEGNTAAHLKAIFCGASQTLAIVDGRLVVGAWQAVQFYEFDGPRQREVQVTLVETTA
ncbi:MAG: YjbQ family protein [Fimbriimonadaceae bacterium]|nr:YjbQ family protein [Fimbriimonadaceae bacterium]